MAALVLDNGEVLTEGPAILQFIADAHPEAGLAPANGSWERVRLQELLNFITSEVHSGSAPLFSSYLPEEAKAIFREKLFRRLDYLSQLLGEQDYLTGGFGIADPYLFTVLKWLPAFQIDIQKWPVLARFVQRMEKRPAVQAAIAAEEATAPV
ncbi:Glutathione S-transferase GST-6.0 [compost metagenome]